MMAVSTLLKSCATPPASWPDGLHLLALRELRLELALLGHVERVDVDPLLGALDFLGARDIEPDRLVAATRQGGIDRLDLGALGDSGGNGLGQSLAARLADELGHRLHVDRRLAAGPAEDPAERRVGADDPAGLVERGDGERRVVEKAREAHFRGAERLFLVGAMAAVEHQRARLAQLAIGEAGGAVHQADRETGAVAANEVDIDDFGADFAVAATAHEEACAIATHHIVEPDRIALELGEVVAKPVGQRRVEILDAALGIGGKEAGRRMVEIVDGALQFEKGVVLPLAVAGDVLNRPQDQRFAAAVDLRQGADADAIP